MFLMRSPFLSRNILNTYMKLISIIIKYGKIYLCKKKNSLTRNNILREYLSTIKTYQI